MSPDILFFIGSIAIIVFFLWMAEKLIYLMRFSKKMYGSGYRKCPVKLVDYVGKAKFDILLSLYNKETNHGFLLEDNSDFKVAVFFLYHSSLFPGGNTGFMGFISLQTDCQFNSFFIRKKRILEDVEKMNSYYQDVFLISGELSKSFRDSCIDEVGTLFDQFPDICLRGFGQYITAYEIGKAFSYKEIVALVACLRNIGRRIK